MTGASGQDFMVVVTSDGCEIIALSPTEAAVLAYILEIIRQDYP